MKTLTIALFAFLTVFISAQSQTPQLQWVKQIGGGSDDYATSVTADATGNMYTVGIFNGSVDFDPGAGNFPLKSTSAYPSQVFISKLDASGNFVWAKTIEGTGTCNVNSITVDASGNLYMTGNFYNGTLDFNPGNPTINITSLGFSSARMFILKLDTEGNFKWVVSPDGYAYGNSVKTDKSGNVYITGSFQGLIDFDPGEGIYNLVRDGNFDIFVLKLDSLGSFKWVKQFEGTFSSSSSNSTNTGTSISVDLLGNIYTTGGFYSTVDFDPGSAKFNLTAPPYGAAMFISKLDSSGNFVWAECFGNLSAYGSNFMTTDLSGNIYIAGSFGGSFDFDPGPDSSILNSNGDKNAFILKFNSSGTLLWAKRMGGGETTAGSGIAIDGLGSVYITGMFTGTADFDPGSKIYPLKSSRTNQYDQFFAKLDIDGNFEWASQFTTIGNIDIAVDMSNGIYIVGGIYGVGDYDPSEGTHYLSSDGKSDIFIEKLQQVPLGMNELKENVPVFVFPIPSRNSITVKFGKQLTNGRIKLINLLGQTMLEQSDVSGTSLSMDITSQPKGMYFVEVSVGGNVERMKVVKE